MLMLRNSFLGRISRIFYVNNDSGSFSIIFALSVIPLTIAATMAFDISAVIFYKQKLRSVGDSAILFAARTQGKDPTTEEKKEIVTKVRRFITQNLVDDTGIEDLKINVSFRDSGNGMDVSLNAWVESYFGSLAGIDKYNIRANIGLQFQEDTIHVALVLDNSSSMLTKNVSGISKLEELQYAVRAFNDVLFRHQVIDGVNISEGQINLQVGVVPFAATVNVGSQYANASWMDTQVLSPIHTENFDQHISRFELYHRMGMEWGGCVEARPRPYDVHDYEVDIQNINEEDKSINFSRNAKYFVPWFQVDEPDSIDQRSGKSILPMFLRVHKQYAAVPDNYLLDALPFDRAQDSLDQWDKKENGVAVNRWFARSRNTSKYTQKNILRRMTSFPSESCNPSVLSPIIDLTSDPDSLDMEVFQLNAGSFLTNILTGMAWGWRLLTPGEPFTQSQGGGVKRVIVLLSDGTNTMPHVIANPMLSGYSAFGYAYTNRQEIEENLVTESSRKIALLGERGGYDPIVLALERESFAALDRRTSLICENIKNDGILIYSIAFGEAAYDPKLKKLLLECASTPAHFAVVTDQSLKSTFQSIAADLTEMYLDR